jgi:drug/metabolite transporter (DMT)-like permease
LGFGVSFLQVFLAETLFAAIFFGSFARSFFKKVRPSKPSHWWSLLGLGLSTIGVGNLLFYAFSVGPVAIGATLMFMYLPVVYAYSLLAKHQSFSLRKLIAILSILVGAFLTTEIATSFKEPGALPAVFASLTAAMCWAVVFILTPGVAGHTTTEFRCFAVSGIGFMGTLILLAFVPDLWFPISGNLWAFAGLVIVLGAVGQTLPVIALMRGLPLTGSSLGGVLSSIELPIAVFSSAIILGESLNILKVAGVVLVLTGIVYYNLSDRDRR